ncbi:hypothetical protein ABPG74_006718 [Tetrahymena malaccensis]
MINNEVYNQVVNISNEFLTLEFNKRDLSKQMSLILAHMKGKTELVLQRHLTQHLEEDKYLKLLDLFHDLHLFQNIEQLEIEDFVYHFQRNPDKSVNWLTLDHRNILNTEFKFLIDYQTRFNHNY